MQRIVTILLGGILLLSGCSSQGAEGRKGSGIAPFVPPPGGASPETYSKRVFYELWVRAVQDGNGDGIGDLKGLSQRIPELKELGIGGVWLMPLYPSPLNDSGYDISDYTSIHPDYGTMEEFRAVVEAFHAAGILVYLDMVFNHTSVDHPWFRSLVQEGKRSPYFDYYILSPQPLTSCSEAALGPFGGERWTLLPGLDLYYFHQFLPSQPDLNFWNPRVREELLEVLRFWIAQGVDGFRFDVPDRYYEKGARCSMLPETLAFFEDLRREIRGGPGRSERGFVGEIWGLPGMVRAALTPERFPMVFHFSLYFALLEALLSEGSPRALVELVELSLRGLPQGVHWALISGNHDLPRLATLLGEDPRKLRLALGLILTLPGVPFLWMGDELGLPNGRGIRIDARDLARTPYPWEPTAPGYGFTEGNSPYLPFVEGAARYAFSEQWRDPESLLQFTRRLIMVRNLHPALQEGEYRLMKQEGALWVFARELPEERILIAANFSREQGYELPLGATGGVDLLLESPLGSSWPIPPLTLRIAKVR